MRPGLYVLHSRRLWLAASLLPYVWPTPAAPWGRLAPPQSGLVEFSTLVVLYVRLWLAGTHQPTVTKPWRVCSVWIKGNGKALTLDHHSESLTGCNILSSSCCRKRPRRWPVLPAATSAVIPGLLLYQLAVSYSIVIAFVNNRPKCFGEGRIEPSVATVESGLYLLQCSRDPKSLRPE